MENSELICAFRKVGKAARKALVPSVRHQKSEEIVDRILKSQEFAEAYVIMIYKAFGGEVELDALEEAIAENDEYAASKCLVYPLCISKTEMIALQPQGNDAWMSGSYGITEPIRDKSIEVNPEDIDLVICPCTSFDEECNRIGMGGGYYDRYLTKCSKAKIVAVAFEVQKAEEIPRAEWDRPMQKVFTEDAVYVK